MTYLIIALLILAYRMVYLGRYYDTIIKDDAVIGVIEYSMLTFILCAFWIVAVPAFILFKIGRHYGK